MFQFNVSQFHDLCHCAPYILPFPFQRVVEYFSCKILHHLRLNSLIVLLPVICSPIPHPTWAPLCPSSATENCTCSLCPLVMVSGHTNNPTVHSALTNSPHSHGVCGDVWTIDICPGVSIVLVVCCVEHPT